MKKVHCFLALQVSGVVQVSTQVLLEVVRIPDFSAKFTKLSAKFTKLSANRKVHYSARHIPAEAYYNSNVD